MVTRWWNFITWLVHAAEHRNKLFLLNLDLWIGDSDPEWLIAILITTRAIWKQLQILNLNPRFFVSIRFISDVVRSVFEELDLMWSFWFWYCFYLFLVLRTAVSRCHLETGCVQGVLVYYWWAEQGVGFCCGVWPVAQWINKLKILICCVLHVLSWWNIRKIAWRSFAGGIWRALDPLAHRALHRAQYLVFILLLAESRIFTNFEESICICSLCRFLPVHFTHCPWRAPTFLKVLKSRHRNFWTWLKRFLKAIGSKDRLHNFRYIVRYARHFIGIRRITFDNLLKFEVCILHFNLCSWMIPAVLIPIQYVNKLLYLA